MNALTRASAIKRQHMNSESGVEQQRASRTTTAVASFIDNNNNNCSCANGPTLMYV